MIIEFRLRGAEKKKKRGTILKGRSNEDAEVNPEFWYNRGTEPKPRITKKKKSFLYIVQNGI